MRIYMEWHRKYFFILPSFTLFGIELEHMWDVVGRAISIRINAAGILQELALAVQEGWDNIPLDTINALIVSLPYYRTGEGTQNIITFLSSL